MLKRVTNFLALLQKFTLILVVTMSMVCTMFIVYQTFGPLIYLVEVGPFFGGNSSSTMSKYVFYGFAAE